MSHVGTCPYATCGNLYAYGANNPVRYTDPDGKFVASDGTVLIHNPSAEDKGSIYYPDNAEKEWSNFK